MKFSIILPTYNRGGVFLRDAINSIISQTYEDWELIIIDNNSTDNTLDLIKSLKNKKIKVYQINNHGNIAKSRNLGIQKSTGSYIALIDSDDFWEKDKLLYSFRHFEKNNINGFSHSENWLYQGKFTKIKHYGPEKNFSYSNLLKYGNCLSLSAVVIHKEALMRIGGFSEEKQFITAEDYDLWLRLARNNYKISFSKKVLGTFRIHGKSESDNIIKNVNAVSDVIESHYSKYRIFNPKKSKAISRCWMNAGKSYQIKGEYINSFKSYLKSLKFSFTSIYVCLLIISLLIPHKVFLSIYKNK